MDYDFKRYGLLHTPDLGEQNDEDRLDSWIIEAKRPMNLYQFSDENYRITKETVKRVEEAGGCNAVLEIGVCRTNSVSSTSAIITTKRQECKYLGVDKQPNQEDVESNFFFLQHDSGDYEAVSGWVKSLGVEKFDLIFIDGFHSVNQVLKEWKYTEWLSDHGCVMLHDTSIHPGPVELLKALDPKVWKLEQHLLNDHNDWGISCVWKR
mgnify:CR=1 FL=1